MAERERHPLHSGLQQGGAVGGQAKAGPGPAGVGPEHRGPLPAEVGDEGDPSAPGGPDRAAPYSSGQLARRVLPTQSRASPAFWTAAIAYQRSGEAARYRWVRGADPGVGRATGRTI